MVEIRLPLLEKIVDIAVDWLRRDRRKTLPQRLVVVGLFAKKDLKVDVCAEIVLGETIVPDVELFLRRLRPDRLPLSSCGTQIDGPYRVLLDDVRGDVRRRGFLDYWTRYQEAIQLLTRGKDHKFKLPQ